MHHSEERDHCPRPGSTATPTTTGQAGCLFCTSVTFTTDLAFQEGHSDICTWPALTWEPQKWWWPGSSMHVCDTVREALLLTSPTLNPKGGNVLDLSFDEETVMSSHSFCSDFPRNIYLSWCALDKSSEAPLPASLSYSWCFCQSLHLCRKPMDHWSPLELLTRKDSAGSCCKNYNPRRRRRRIGRRGLRRRAGEVGRPLAVSRGLDLQQTAWELLQHTQVKSTQSSCYSRADRHSIIEASICWDWPYCRHAFCGLAHFILTIALLRSV